MSLKGRPVQAAKAGKVELQAEFKKHQAMRGVPVLVALAAVASCVLQGCLPPDWSFCDCDFRDNFWNSILNDVHLLWDGPDFVRKARDNSTFQGRYLQSPPSDLNCPVSPTVFWKAWPQYGITRGLIEGSMGDLWMPGARDRFKQVCIAGHLALMAICSQHFLVKSARAQDAGDPDHMKWLEASYGHMVAIRNLGQAYQIRQCMGQQGWSLDVGAFHKYTTRWIGRESEGTSPQAAFFNGKVDPWQMLFTQPMHHTSESRASALPDRRVCVPFKDPACWKRKSLLLMETCEYCCNPFEHKTGRGASWCWDDEWTYERCCQQDYKDLVCEVRRKGEEGGCVDCKKSVTYVCMTPPEKRLQDAQNNYNAKVDLFNSLQQKATTLASDIETTKKDLLSKDELYRQLLADLNTKLQTWHFAFNNASRLVSVARLKQQEESWNNSKMAWQQAEETLRSAQSVLASAEAVVSDARKQEQLGRQLLASNESAYEMAKSRHAASEKALAVANEKQQASEREAAEAEVNLQSATTAADQALDISLSVNKSREAIYHNTSHSLEEATALRDAIREQAWTSLLVDHAAKVLSELSRAQAGRVCRPDPSVVDPESARARIRSAQQSVNEAQASRTRSADEFKAAGKDEELVQQAMSNCSRRGSSCAVETSTAMECLIASTPANKSAKPAVQSQWQKELCSGWTCEAIGGCTDCKQANELELNTLTQRLLESKRLANEALSRSRTENKLDLDEDIYVPAALLSAVEECARQTSQARDRQMLTAKASREAQISFEKAKAHHEACKERHAAAQKKVVERQAQTEETSVHLMSSREHLQRNETALQQRMQHLVRVNRTAEDAGATVEAAINQQAKSKMLYTDLAQQAEQKKNVQDQELQRRAQASEHVQALNETLADNLTVLVSAWLRQQEQASEASHSSRWSERLLAAAKAVLVNMVGSFESFLENYVISISDKDAAMQVMRAMENLKAVELTCLEAEKNAEDAAQEVRQAEERATEAEAARAVAEEKALNATSNLADAQEAVMSAETFVNQTRKTVESFKQRLHDLQSSVAQAQAEVTASAAELDSAAAALEKQADHVRTSSQDAEVADAEVAKAVASEATAAANVATAKAALLGSSLATAKRECQPTETEFEVFLHFREQLGLAKHVVVQRLQLWQMSEGVLQQRLMVLQDAQAVHEALLDDLLDAVSGEAEHVLSNAAADADLLMLQAEVNASTAIFGECNDNFSQAQAEVSAILHTRHEADALSQSSAAAYMAASSKRVSAEENMVRRRRELEAARNASAQAAADLTRSVEAEAEAKKSVEKTKVWQANFNASLEIARKEEVRDEAQEEKRQRQSEEAKARQREARMRSLLDTHKRHLALCDLQVELPQKDQSRAEAKAAFDKAEKALADTQASLESYIKDEAETHSKIHQTYKELGELKTEHATAEKEYAEQDPEDRKRSFTTSLQGSGA